MQTWGCDRERRRPLSAVLCIVGVLSGSLGASAQEVRVPVQAVSPPEVVPAPPELDVPQVSLSEAVELALNHNPEVLGAKQDVAFSIGRYQEARGLFDGVVRVAPGYSYTKNQIRPFILSRERDKREQLEVIRDNFMEVNGILNDSLAEMVPRPPACPEELEFIQFSDPFILDRLDPVEASVTGVDQPLRGTQSVLAGLEFQLEDVCVPATQIGIPRDVFVDFWNELNRINNAGLDDIIVGFTQFPRESVALASEISEAVWRRAELARERLGEVPDTEIRKVMFLEASYIHPLRNGINVIGETRLSSEEQRFEDRILDPVFGGFEFNTPFTSFVSVTMETPLAKGRGRITAQAPERAAELTLDAQRQFLRHTLSTEVFRTILAYVNLVAAQRALELLEQSAERQRQILDITQQIVDAGDLPLSELERARARAASVFASVNSGRLSRLSARLSLAQLMGVSATDLERAPLAGDDFPESTRPAAPTESLTRQAISMRRDIRALSSVRESSRVLADAASFDLKRRYDLSATFGLSPLYTTPFFRFLPDEAQPIETYETLPPPEDSPVHFYSPTGYWRMLTSEWQPFVAVGITFELPFGNNVAEGQAQQALASFRRSDIQRTDLGRVVYENVLEVAQALELAARALEARRSSLDLYQETLDAARERYQTGDITLLDLLVTEEDLTRENIAYVGDLQVYYSVLARLEFETGRILRFENEDEPSESAVFDPSGFAR